jgi:hypothetical protein
MIAASFRVSPMASLKPGQIGVKNRVKGGAHQRE